MYASSTVLGTTETTSRTASTSVDITLIGVIHNGTGLVSFIDGIIGAIGFFNGVPDDAGAAALHAAMIALVT